MRRLAWRGVVAGGAVALVGSLLWLHRTPPVGDLAAQVAWAHLASRVGEVPWFARWYQGVPVGGYSLLSPPLMGWLGVRTVGALATVATGVLAGCLLASARRPTLGAAAFGVAATADLYSGRVTFAVGGAFAFAALLAAEHKQTLAVGVLTVLTTLSSPVAGLFLLVPGVAYLLSDGARRRQGLVMTAAFVLVGLLSAVVFPGAGREPFTSAILGPSLAIPAAAALLPVGRRVRTGLLLAAAAVLAAYLVTSPVGSNVTRLSILVVVPVVVASVRRTAFIPLTGVLAIWPWYQVHGDLTVARHPSATSAYAAPLITELRSLAQGPDAQRVEVVEPRTHWALTRLTDAGITTARGWERQVDEARNPLFYGRVPLTAATYRSWLDAGAVAWVALPTDAADIDFGSAAEGRLVRSGLLYLRSTWSNADWTVYAVTDPQPVSGPGATVTRLTDTGAQIVNARPVDVTLQLRWSPWYVIDGGSVSRDGQNVRLHLTRAGKHRLHAEWRWP